MIFKFSAILTCKRPFDDREDRSFPSPSRRKLEVRGYADKPDPHKAALSTQISNEIRRIKGTTIERLDKAKKYYTKVISDGYPVGLDSYILGALIGHADLDFLKVLQRASVEKKIFNKNSHVISDALAYCIKSQPSWEKSYEILVWISKGEAEFELGYPIPLNMKMVNPTIGNCKTLQQLQAISALWVNFPQDSAFRGRHCDHHTVKSLSACIQHSADLDQVIPILHWIAQGNACFQQSTYALDEVLCNLAIKKLRSLYEVQALMDIVLKYNSRPGVEPIRSNERTYMALGELLDTSIDLEVCIQILDYVVDAEIENKSLFNLSLNMSMCNCVLKKCRTVEEIAKVQSVIERHNNIIPHLQRVSATDRTVMALGACLEQSVRGVQGIAVFNWICEGNARFGGVCCYPDDVILTSTIKHCQTLSDLIAIKEMVITYNAHAVRRGIRELCANELTISALGDCLEHSADSGNRIRILRWISEENASFGKFCCLLNTHMLTSVLKKCQSLEEAVEIHAIVASYNERIGVFKTHGNIVTYFALNECLEHLETPGEQIKILRWMVEGQASFGEFVVAPGLSTFSSALKKCQTLLELQDVQSLMWAYNARVETEKLKGDEVLSFSLSACIEHLETPGEQVKILKWIVEAQANFGDFVVAPDVMTFTSALKKCRTLSELQEVQSLMLVYNDRLGVNRVHGDEVLSFSLSACIEHLDTPGEQIKILKWIVEAQANFGDFVVAPDVVTFTSALKKCRTLGELKEVQALMKAYNDRIDVEKVNGNSLLFQTLGKCIENLDTPDESINVLNWILDGHACFGDCVALPDVTMFNSALKTCQTFEEIEHVLNLVDRWNTFVVEPKLSATVDTLTSLEFFIKEDLTAGRGLQLMDFIFRQNFTFFNQTNLDLLFATIIERCNLSELKLFHKMIEDFGVGTDFSFEITPRIRMALQKSLNSIGEFDSILSWICDTTAAKCFVDSGFFLEMLVSSPDRANQLLNGLRIHNLTIPRNQMGLLMNILTNHTEVLGPLFEALILETPEDPRSRIWFESNTDGFIFFNYFFHQLHTFGKSLLELNAAFNSLCLQGYQQFAEQLKIKSAYTWTATRTAIHLELDCHNFSHTCAALYCRNALNELDTEVRDIIVIVGKGLHNMSNFGKMRAFILDYLKIYHPEFIVQVDKWNSGQLLLERR